MKVGLAIFLLLIGYGGTSDDHQKEKWLQQEQCNQDTPTATSGTSTTTTGASTATSGTSTSTTGTSTATADSSRWWEQSLPLIELAIYQQKIQKMNLFDSYQGESKNQHCEDPHIGDSGKAPLTCNKENNKFRRPDGQCNDYNHPASGSRYYRFGRNVPLNSAVVDEANLFNPNPRMISRKLLERKEFIPAKGINILTAAWIQFMTHDWFQSGPNQGKNKMKVDLQEDDPDFRNRKMKVHRTRSDSCSNDSSHTDRKPYSTFQNTVTHWWDASQIYGSDSETNYLVRSFIDGKLKMTKDGRLPVDTKSGLPITGVNDNWWVGIGMMHIVWTKEHNYVCDELKKRHQDWNDEQLFQTSRLIIAAVIAKIHTLEWTVAILNNKYLKVALKSNWYGASLLELVEGNKQLAEILAKKFPEFANGVPGAVGNPKNVRDVPYSLTQDFIAVYRLHPLMPDSFQVRNYQTDYIEHEYQMEDTVFDKAEAVFDQNSMENLFYSYGNDHPGAQTLHNYPNFLRNLKLPKSSPHGSGRIDLATIDILRDRERGVPRYNEFRRLFHLPAIKSFEELTTNKIHVAELQQMYNGDVEKVDLLVGSLSELPLPENFGFSDTFFRLFILMAKRRLESDRFFTDDYTPEFYTQWGLEYTDHTFMKDVLIRHYPSLSPVLQQVTNVFLPWNKQTT